MYIEGRKGSKLLWWERKWLWYCVTNIVILCDKYCDIVWQILWYCDKYYDIVWQILWYCVTNIVILCDKYCDIVWQIDSCKLRGNLNTLDRKIFSKSLVKSRYIYIYIYIYVTWWHVQLHCQCMKLWMNQFSSTQRSITTAGYDELRWTSASSKLSSISILQKSDVLSEAKYSLCVVAAFCVHSVECVEGVLGKE